MRADIDMEGIPTRCDGGEKEKRLKTIESDCLLAAASPSHADTRGRTGRAECQVEASFIDASETDSAFMLPSNWNWWGIAPSDIMLECV